MADIPTYHVLALSGGGYRGLYTATVLAELETVLGRPIASHFDLICGTSAGGMLALGLAAEIPAYELKALFEEQGRRIFGSRSLSRRLLGFWLTAKHDSAGLREVLTERFQETTIGDLKHRVLVPAVNYSTGLGQFFKTPHHPSFELDHRMKVVDVALATAAAPVYFPLARNDRGVFADGGLVGNAPGLFGFHEVKTFLAPKQDVLVRVLSIGTMTIGATVRGGASLDRGFGKWRGGLFDLVISAQESSVDYMLRQALGDNYFQIDDKATPDQSKDVKALDRVSIGATNTLKARGSHAAQRALGNPLFKPFRDHQAGTPIFYHGPNKNVSEDAC
ncbi:CBASS cGAMP-activated phospholipase [Zobellella iuensis]|uniref:Patatin-like phospholipase family protein n=1 Tax=Zobellella iuensis TaxID=2803811 RepID=A0ABS1QNN3_9GAMM|nr:CBASS cGAMP-activated phospholipase [Zobellella iuensis]MBL1376467.1 patatin-like phospholipase family protein [Zobellella iuensis]